MQFRSCASVYTILCNLCSNKTKPNNTKFCMSFFFFFCCVALFEGKHCSLNVGCECCMCTFQSSSVRKLAVEWQDGLILMTVTPVIQRIGIGNCIIDLVNFVNIQGRCYVPSIASQKLQWKSILKATVSGCGKSCHKFCILLRRSAS